MTAAETRTCSKCREAKPLDTFTRDARYCRPCRAAYARAWRDANRDRYNRTRAYWRADITDAKKGGGAVFR